MHDSVYHVYYTVLNIMQNAKEELCMIQSRVYITHKCASCRCTQQTLGSLSSEGKDPTEEGGMSSPQGRT